MTNLKTIIVLGSLWSSFSCGGPKDKIKFSSERKKSASEVQGYKKDSLTQTSNKTDSRRWNFEKYLADPATPKLAKDIYYEKWKLKDDEPLLFLEKLTGEDKQARPFYFRVVTNSYKQADGAYAEGLGNCGFEYIKNNTNEFTSYFIGNNAFTEKDLETWADIVMLEFGIIAESESDQSLLKDYVRELQRNCKDCSLEQKNVLNKFSTLLEKKWSEM